jgi:antibiotic biosynthesis monooxygenase (ABM) superfamily enzyme
MTASSPVAPGRDGVTVVITHRVREGMHPEYEVWMDEISTTCRSWPGHLDWQVIRPMAGVTSSYTVVIRFDTRENLLAWMESGTRKALIERAQPLLTANDEYSIHSGLDFWFMPKPSDVKVPVLWKQFLITWSAIFPLVVGVHWLAVPAMRSIGLPGEGTFAVLVETGIVVFLMAYVVMPHYTRLVCKWLFA